MVECIVCNTFIYLLEHLLVLQRLSFVTLFLVLLTLLHYGRAQYGAKEHMVCNTFFISIVTYLDYEINIYFTYTCSTWIII
jgi:hypothetical protein